MAVFDMNQEFRLLIHVGYFKTATTWLQERVFKRECKHGFFVPRGLSTTSFGRLFRGVSPYVFDADKVRQHILNVIASNSQGALVPVLSDEHLTGNPTHGYYHGYEMATRLHLAFPDASILIGIRNQKAMLMSLYRQYLKVGGTFRLDEFIGTNEDDNRGALPICRLDYLDFEVLIRHYYELFGKERVLVMPIELLEKNPAGYLTRLTDFMGLVSDGPIDHAPVNYGLRGVTLGIRRRLNYFTNPRPLGRPPSTMWRASGWACKRLNRIIPEHFHVISESKLRAFINMRVGDRFFKSNSQLGELIGIDLRPLGYESDSRQY